MSHNLEVGDRAYYTTRDDTTCSEGYGFIKGISAHFGAKAPRSVTFYGDDGKTFTGSEDEFVPVPEFREGDIVIHTYHLDSHAEYYGVVGTVLSYLPGEGELRIQRFDENKDFTGQDYEFTLVVPAVDTVTSDSEDQGWAGFEELDDPVNHPSHYTNHPSGVECIEITEHMGFNLGNAVKYIWRADLKDDAIEDLRKASWYVDRELAKREA